VSARSQAARLVEALPDAIVVVDGQRRVLLVNAEAERMFGYARGELLGQPAGRFVPDEVWGTGESGPARAQGALPQPRVPGPTLRARHRDGRELPVDIRVSALATPAGRVSLGVIRPAGRAPEDGPLAARQPGAALVEISHDLRNSLGVIANAVHYLGVVLPGDPRVRKHLDLIQREVAAATHVLGGLLRDAHSPRADGPEPLQPVVESRAGARELGRSPLRPTDARARES
jgi:PAS domain S-box-containing protein